MGKWKLFKASEIIEFNPHETIKKGVISKKISMERLQPFSRDVFGFENVPFTNGTKFRNGDTLMARITPCLENGKIAQMSLLNENEVGFGSTEYIIGRAKKGISDSNYVYYLMCSSIIRDIAIKSMVGSSGRQRVQLDVVKNIELSVPTLDEQIEIGKMLKVLDDKIENNRKINHHLEQMAQAIFKSWFIDFEPFGGEIPLNWKEESLTDIANYLNGLAMQKFQPIKNEESIPVLKIKELRQGFFDSASDKCSLNIKPQYIIYDGDVIFSWSGSLLVDFWTGGISGLNQHLFKVTSEKYKKWFYYIWTKYHLDEFIAMAAARATTMGHIKRDALEKAKVLVPDIENHDILDKLLDPIYTKIISNRIENRKLIEVRDALLPKLMSGEISLSQTTK